MMGMYTESWSMRASAWLEEDRRGLGTWGMRHEEREESGCSEDGEGEQAMRQHVPCSWVPGWCLAAGWCPALYVYDTVCVCARATICMRIGSLRSHTQVQVTLK
jgi:hypothetical protein